ncbi:MAG: GNAT family N-acetyltransferase [Treponema sp.]|nr:GNAT family N-acetyltransferase [Treponema sp.]
MIQKLETEHLILRKAQKKDLDSIYKNVWSDSSLAKYMLWTPLNSIEEAEERLIKVFEFQKTNNNFFVCLKATDEVIGFAGIIQNQEEPEVYEAGGICIASKYQKKGYGKEVLSALASLIFNELGGLKFHYSCFKENIASANLSESLGFKYINTVKKIRRHDNLEYDSMEFELEKNYFG